MWCRTASRFGIPTKRLLSISSGKNAKAAYEGEGKTTIKILNQDYDSGILINSYATYGFRLNNGITVLGPIIIFAKAMMSWQVTGSEAITPESLRLFKILEPKPDLIIIGLETNEREALSSVFKASKANGLNTEILTTEHACATYNFLCAEGRSVAAALIPPISVTMNEDDQLETGIHYRDMFNSEKN